MELENELRLSAQNIQKKSNSESELTDRITRVQVNIIDRYGSSQYHNSFVHSSLSMANVIKKCTRTYDIHDVIFLVRTRPMKAQIRLQFSVEAIKLVVNGQK